MTKQLRKRIMFTMMLLLSITFISIITAINIWIRTDNRIAADNNLRFLMQREMKPDIPMTEEEQEKHIKPFDYESSEHSIKPEPEKSGDRPMEIATSHFILAKYTSDHRLISIKNTLSDSYSDEEIEQFCEEVLNADKPQGTIKQLRYVIHKNTNGIVIAFIDHTAEERGGKNLLIISVILGFVGLISFAFLSYVLSGLMVRPVEEAFEKQKQFISDASHELKTPITVILSNSELLVDQIGENKQLSHIKKECDQMQYLVTSLLTLTHLEQTPCNEGEMNIFSMSNALLECILPLESIAFEKGISMDYNVPPDISCYGVKEQIQQVATILIDNALNHADSCRQITISLQKNTHHVSFIVSNTGEDIPEEKREKLFERFYRMDQARNRASGHFGLGLSIAKKIVTNHKGHIQVECANGITSFIVSLKIS